MRLLLAHIMTQRDPGLASNCKLYKLHLYRAWACNRKFLFHSSFSFPCPIWEAFIGTITKLPCNLPHTGRYWFLDFRKWLQRKGQFVFVFRSQLSKGNLFLGHNYHGQYTANCHKSKQEITEMPGKQRQYQFSWTGSNFRWDIKLPKRMWGFVNVNPQDVFPQRLHPDQQETHIYVFPKIPSNIAGYSRDELWEHTGQE